MTDSHNNPGESRQCPSCGTTLPSDAPAGLCPQCLLKQGLTDDSEAITQEASPIGQPIAGATWLASESSGRGGRFVPPPPNELASQFPQLEILELLGQGGMGAVYKARQRDLDRVIALKILPHDAGDGETFAQRFSREAKALAKLNHANIVMVHEFGRTVTGLYFIIMEYVDGLNLRQLLRDHKLTPAEALAIVPQICEALQFAHEEGIVHRDIKPENILIDKKGRVKIADFGLAKLMATSPEDVTLTRDGGMMGTPQYMAPEQLEGAKHVDHRADIYSLGVVFYELLTGELPLGRFDPPSRRVQIDVRLDEVVMRTLEKEPARRYQHASEVKTQVETIGGLTPQQFEGVKQAMGREYKSKATLFGIPLVHVATGIDPKTGKKRVAKGIIALGDVAVGVFAAGGAAFGGVTFGGMSFGLLSLGGLAIGLLAAIGGLAVGSIAFGGVAIGGAAIGGAAVGYYAFGGGAWGQYVASGGHADPHAKAFFEGWAEHWPKWLAAIGVAVPVGCVMVGTLIWIALRSGSSTSGWDDDGDDIDQSGRSPDRRSSDLTSSLSIGRTKPRIIPLLGACNIIAGIALLAIGTVLLLPADTTDRLLQLEQQALPFPELTQVYDVVIAPVYFACTIAFFVAGVGLLMYQPWARRVTIAVCLFQLLMLAVDVPMLLLTTIVPTFKLVTNAEYQSLMDFADESEAMTFAIGMSLFITFIVLAIIGFLIGQIVILNRSSVKAAMASDVEAPTFAIPGDQGRSPDEARRATQAPAVGLIVCGVVTLIAHVGFFVYGLIEDPRPLDPPILLSLIGIPFGVFVLLGGIAMMKRRVHALATFGAVTALFPVGPVWLLSLPYGIYALMVLSRAEVKNVFWQTLPSSRISDETNGMADDERTLRPLDDNRSGFVCAVIALVLFVLALVVPPILLAVVGDPDRATAASATFVIGMLLAFVFGLLGRHHRLGRWTAGLAFVIGLGVLSLVFVSDSQLQPNNGSMVTDVIKRGTDDIRPRLRGDETNMQTPTTIELRTATVPMQLGVNYHPPGTTNHARYKSELAEHGPTALHRRENHYRWCELLIQPVTSDTKLIVGEWDSRQFLLLSNDARHVQLGGRHAQATPLLGEVDEGWQVKNTSLQKDPSDDDRYQVSMTIDPPLALERVTESIVGHRLALVINGKVLGLVPDPRQIKDGRLLFKGLTESEASRMMHAVNTGTVHVTTTPSRINDGK